MTEPADKPVAAIGPDGLPITVPRSAVPELEAAHGRVMSAAEEKATRHQLELDEKYDPFRHPLTAYLGQTGASMAGLYRGLTLGLSDVALSKLGGEGVSSELNELRETHPLTSAGTELAGSLASFAAGGEVFGAARAPTVAGRIVGGGLRGSLEMGLWNAGKTAGEQALANEDLDGEKIVAGFGHGAIMGLVGGAGLTALGEGVSALRLRPPSVRSGVASEMRRPIGREVSTIDTEAGLRGKAPEAEQAFTFSPEEREVGLRPNAFAGSKGAVPEVAARRPFTFKTEEERLFNGTLKRGDTTFRINPDAGLSPSQMERGEDVADTFRMGKARPRGVEFAGGEDLSPLETSFPIRVPYVPKEAAAPEASSLGGMLRKQADVKTIKALGGSAGDLRALERNVSGGFQRVAQDIRSDIEATTGKSIGRHTQESIHDYAVARRAELGKQEGDLLAKIDRAKVGIAPDVQSFVRDVRSDVLGSALVSDGAGGHVIAPGAEATVNAVEKFLGQIEGATANRAPTFTDWHQWRVNLDKMAKFESANVSPTTEALQRMRGLMEQHLETAGEEAAQKMGGHFQAEYQATKSLYQSVTKAAELTERGVARGLVNNSVGVRALGAGLAGLIHGGPVMGIAAGVAGKLIQDRGDVLAADLLDRAASIAGARRYAARAENTVVKGVQQLIGKAANDTAAREVSLAPPARGVIAPMGVKLTGDKRKDYQAIQSQLTSSAANPARTTDRLSQAMGSLPSHAPKAAQSVIDTTLRGSSYLLAQSPKSRADTYSLQPQLDKSLRLSDAEVSTFLRKASAVDDPTLILREAKDGTLTRDHVEAVKAVYPNLYEDIRSQVMRSLVDSKTELPYARRIQLGILLDIPTDKTLAPDFVQAIQATYSSAEKAGAETPPPTLSRPINIANSLQTSTQTAQMEGLER